MTRILITAVVSCVLAAGIAYMLLPVLRALKAGQSIREIGPTWHNYKAGTPMMGGLMFISSTLICLLCKRNIGLKCAWAVYLCIWVLLTVFTGRWF